MLRRLDRYSMTLALIPLVITSAVAVGQAAVTTSGGRWARNRILRGCGQFHWYL